MIPFSWVGVRPASVLVVSGTESFRKRLQCPFPVDPEKTRILWAHSLDYDLYLDEIQHSKSVQETNTGVFLDELMPLHPDLVHMGAQAPCTPENYYPALRHFFDFVEKKTGVQVVVAAHPRTTGLEQGCDFGNRSVIKGQTIHLVRQAKFVMAHSSTSINMAVLFEKPVVFLTTDELERNDRQRHFIFAVAKWLGKTPLNIDTLQEVDWAKEMIVNRGAYGRFREAFIKKVGASEKPLWKIVADSLRQRGPV